MKINVRKIKIIRIEDDKSMTRCSKEGRIGQVETPVIFKTVQRIG